MTFPPAPAARGALLPARIAISLAFFNLGAAGGLWAAFIPIVTARLAISEGTLGLVLLAIAAGSLVAMPATGWAIIRYGSRAIAPAAAAALPVAAALPLLAPTLPLLFLAALLFGAAAGTLDVAINNEAARFETVSGRPTMSSFHAFFSVGGLAGAGTGGLLLGLDGAAASFAAGILAALAVVTILLRGWHLAAETCAGAGMRFQWPSPALLAIGFLAFLSFGLEGAVADWSGLYLVGEKAATPAVAAMAFAAFAGAMALMRFVGDRLIARHGREFAVRAGGIGILAGAVVALLAPWPFLSIAGFAVMGLGAANVVPALFSTAARFPAASGGVSAVSTIGFVGILIWPPVVGGFAEVVGLPVALWLIALAGIVIALRARLVR